MKWLSTNQIKVEPPKHPKKMTGTRFAAVLGLNRWQTPFKTWCDITKTYSEPYEDNMYTIAGKTIEPKQAEYMKKSYYMPNMISPTDKFGKDYFETTHGDFFPTHPIFGGMWDYLLVDGPGKTPTAVLEMKTSKRAEDWAEDVPEYYALQAALYAYLLGVDQVHMVATFLENKDYLHPEDFVCSVDNTIVRSFKVSERYPNFLEDYIKPAKDWWDAYVVRGISPEYDERADADVLYELRRHYLSPTTDIEDLIKEADELESELAKAESELNEKYKRQKELRGMLKEYASQNMENGDKQAVLVGRKYIYTCTRNITTNIDKSALEKDGLLDKYSVEKTSYKLTIKEAK